MNALLDDYTIYHVVRIVAGGVLVVTFILLSIFFWTQWKRVPKTDERKWTFEKQTYFSFGALSIVVGLLLAFIVAANATNVLDPRHGFSLLVDSLGTPKAGTQMDTIYQAFNTWVQSGSATIPPVVQTKIHERIALHTTSAIVYGILLVVFVVLDAPIWRTLIKRSRVREAKWGLQERALLASGVAAVALSLLLMVMVVVNVQGAIAPITLTLLEG
jgi:hypothetical protein